MADTLIEDVDGEIRPILDIIEARLGADYAGRPYDLEFADYGVPQRRRRLITVYTRTEIGKQFLESGGELVPDPAEVHSIIEPPVDHLLDESRWVSRDFHGYDLWFYEFEEGTLWGATAFIVRELLAHLRE